MKMKLSFLLTLTAIGIVIATEECSSTAVPSLSRSKRGITDFFRRLVGGRRKNPTYHHQHQSASPFGHSGSSSSLYGGGNAAGSGQDFLYGQSSNQYPMYQSNGGLQQQQQASEYVFPGISSSQSNGFAFGNYGSPNGNNAQQPSQPQFYYNSQPGQENGGYANQGEQAVYQQQGGEQQEQNNHHHNQPQQYHHMQQQQHQHSFHHPGGYPHHFQQPGQHQYHHQNQHSPVSQFQSEESTNQAAISYAEVPSSSSQQAPGHSAVTADQDGIASSGSAFLPQSQPLMTQAQSHAVAAYLNGNVGNNGQQQHPGFAASYNRPQYAPYPEASSQYPSAARPYGGSNPGTLDVHQVLDQFIRSAGLSPQGDHESVKGDQHYDGSDLKPALSVKKLISYPFYFSSSGDKPTSYGQSIRRHSQEETIFKSALNQNLLASQKLEQPPKIESKMEPSSSFSTSSSYSQPSPAVSPNDEESQFIAKHAQALQEFLSKPNAQVSSAQAANPAAHYYSPLSEGSSTKDNKVTSSSSPSSSANGQTKV